MKTAIAGYDTEITLPAPLRLERGGSIPRPTIGLRQWGAPDRPVVLLLGGISATRRAFALPGEAPGWWQQLVDASRVLSGGAVQLVSADFLAGTGTSSRPPSDAAVSTADQASAIVAAAVAVGLPPFSAVVGASYGGMVALALAERHPGACRQVVAISAAHRSHPMASALRWIQREILVLGRAAGDAKAGVALARALAMTTYRTAAEYEERFGYAAAGSDDAARYLAGRGRTFAEQWSAERFAVLLRSLDQHDVTPGRITDPVALIGVSTDALVPPWQLEQLRLCLGGSSTLTVLDSPWGHDAFLKEPRRLGALLDLSLDTLVP